MHFAQVARQSHRVIVSHQRGNGHRRRRSYSSSSSDADPEQQPPRLVWPADAKPTPYQVLHVDAGRPYEKTNFVRLVKLYHPDMHRSSSSSIQDGTMSPQTRLHRYHLVVAAHQLLSSPAQRRRYDLYKMGWLAHTPPSATTQDPPPPSRAETWPPRTENDDDDDHDRPSPLKQVPIYMSNHAFAILLLVLAFGFAIASCERIRRERRRRRGGGLGRLVDIVDGDIVRSLYGAQHLVSGRSKDERILAFLCRRHVTAMGGRQEVKDEDEDEEDKKDEVEQHQGGFLPMDEHWEQNMCRH
ncbi:DnaJ domain-containing protein [Beauveria bassiana ARSEF 2860]|uniref:DnaJ domain-containing protein n=1 Tax=Beauveria bassiana (strain ARSEF 2860) TaxID=655819 RepID=J4WEH9_BEAB2|nr:DnaJ domain-containing protein [Beauveria bassiana ARSEF 2860]EJP68395.1 DnaJ domain-containing protein [Beauveria bassiana ARSEF 2860]